MRSVFLLLLGIIVVYTTYFFVIGEPLVAFDRKVFGNQVVYLQDRTPVYVDVADTDQERQIGLANKKSLAANQGMLFVFERDDKWSIWMKNMKFGIDILWLDKSGKVVDIKEFIYPDTYPGSFVPEVDARYILEVVPGFASMHNILLGYKIDLNGL